MDNTLSVRILKIASVNIFLAVLLFFLPAHALEWRNWDEIPFSGQDYFAKDHNSRVRKLLMNVERQHLTKFPGRYAAGQYKYAFEQLEYILGVFPNHPKALALLGVLSKTIGAFSLPMHAYEKALRLYPQHALTHAQYGEYLVGIGRIDAGIAKLKKAIAIDPKLVQAHVWVAKAYYEDDNRELSREAAEKARELGYTGKILEGVQKNR